jgi:NhaA family Na+:H+ antiporter
MTSDPRDAGGGTRAADRRTIPDGPGDRPRRRATVFASAAPVHRVLRPFQEFARLEAAGGIVLMVAALLALVWANSPWAGVYAALRQANLTVGLGELALSKDLLHWVNDGLMALFFLVVGLEIKRELLAGELADRRRAALPIAAALGGMAVPAALYLALNVGTPGARGWGVPVATDIAFALGVLALLGRRAPLALKVFLTALAIVDDIGAVLIIALFYTAGLAWPYLVAAGLVLAALAAANRLGVRRLAVYGLLGGVLWVAFLHSGVHATVAGVLLAMTVPARAHRSAAPVVGRTNGPGPRARPGLADGRGRDGTGRPAGGWTLAVRRREATSPLRRLEHALHPWTTFAVLPLFALANAGVSLAGGDLRASLLDPVGLGVLVGLALGKPAGITLCAWLAVRSRLAALPHGVGWWQVHGAAWLGGIGFTMSLFVAGLAFGDAALLDATKRAVLTASVAAGMVGWLVLRRAATVHVRGRPPSDRAVVGAVTGRGRHGSGPDR